MMDAEAALALNIRIAEQVYGLSEATYPSHEGYMVLGNIGGIAVPTEKIDSHLKPGHLATPKWSTHMVWAWKLVDRFTAKGFLWKLEQLPREHNACWVAAFDGLVWHGAYGKTMPDAICNTALLLVGKQVEPGFASLRAGVEE